MSRRPAFKPAAFAPDPQRRTMIAKIHVAKKELGFDDGDYRALLERVTGKVSTTAMNAGEMGRVLDELARLGWAPMAGGKVQKRSGTRPAAEAAYRGGADHPAAKKARAMLISLGMLGVIRNPSEAALEAFARRQMGTTQLQWADQAQVYKLIEALKAIAQRHGWDQNVAGLGDPIWTLKLRLCGAILRRLVAAGVVPPEETVATVAAGVLGKGPAADAAKQVAVIELSETDLETVARHLADRLAAHAYAAHYGPSEGPGEG
jgi:phage gp16-like protein